YPLGLSHGLTDGLVDWLAAGGGPQDGVDAPATTEGDAEQAPQAAGHFAVRQPALLIEFDDGGLSIPPQLGRGRAGGGGRLQGMALLHPRAALTALPDVDVESPVKGLPRDLDRELLGDVGLVEGPAAVGAGVWQGRLVGFVELVEGRRLAVSLGAV